MKARFRFSTILLAVLLATTSGYSAEVEVHLTDGSIQAGILASIQDASISLAPSAPGKGPAALPLEQVLQVAFKDRPARLANHPVRMALRGGGWLSAQQVVTNDRTADVTLRQGVAVSIPLDRIASMLLASAEPDAVERWRREARLTRQSDRLVAVRGGERAELDGIVGNLNEDRLAFTLDGEQMNVRRDRVFAIHLAGSDTPAPPVEVHDVFGNVWPANRIEWKDDVLKLQSVATSAIEIPSADLATIDYARQRLVFLSDLEPNVIEHVPYFDVAYDVQRDHNFSGAAIKIGSREFKKGLVLHSKTAVAYDLDGQFRRFQTTVGIEASAGPKGDAVVKILADAAVLWEGRARAAADPAMVDVPIENARRLTLVVEFGALADIGDHVAFGDARLVK